MLRYKTGTRPGLVALYDIRPGNGAGLFLRPRSPHGATDCLTSTYYCQLQSVTSSADYIWPASIAQTLCVMSDVRIELRHTKTVMRQSQDETWSYETRAKTSHECVETEPRRRRV